MLFRSRASAVAAKVRMVSKLPGLALVALLTVPAFVLGEFVPVAGGPVIGIVIGMLVQALHPPGTAFRPGIAFASKYVLQASVVLLGAGLSLVQLWETGSASFPVMLGTLLVALAAAALFGRLLRVPGELRTLIGAGTAICGGSAIAATSVVIGASEASIAYAMSTIFAFNAIAVLTFPALGHLMDLSQNAFGLWAGTAINDTSSVVAAGYVYGSAAGAYAVVVKLTRTTMIIPLTLALAVRNTRRANRDPNRGDGAPASATPWRRVVPWFVVWFVIAAVANTIGLVPHTLQTVTKPIAQVMITMALTAVGLSARFGQMRSTGLRPLFFGGMLWVTVAVSSLLLQRAFGLL